MSQLIDHVLTPMLPSMEYRYCTCAHIMSSNRITTATASTEYYTSVACYSHYCAADNHDNCAYKTSRLTDVVATVVLLLLWQLTV
jgi:hypothetical protein